MNIIEQVIKVNLEDNYYSNLSHSLKLLSWLKKFSRITFLIFWFIQRVVFVDIANFKFLNTYIHCC